MSHSERVIALDYRLRQAMLVLMYMAIVAGGLVFFFYIRPVISFALTVASPFLVALIVAYIFNPVVRWLQIKYRLKRIAAVSITYAIIIGITLGFFAVLVPVIYFQLKAVILQVADKLPVIGQKVIDWLYSLNIPKEELQRMQDIITGKADAGALADQAGTAASLVAEKAIGTGRFFTNLLFTAISLVIGLVAFITFVVVITFYFLLDYGRFEHVARVLLPDESEPRIFAIWKKIDRALSGFLRGQLIVAVIVGTLYSIALMALGMKPYAILIGFCAGFGNLVPYLGPVIGGVPSALWVIFGDRFDTGQEKMIGLVLVVGLSSIVQAIDGFFLQPRIVGKNAELHPLLVLLALLIGSQFGLGGVIIAVPLAVVTRVLLKELWWDPLEIRELKNKGILKDDPPVLEQVSEQEPIS